MAIPHSHFDGREMFMVHNVFRREISLMAGLVRGVTPGDTERVKLVSSHMGGVLDILHTHHRSEDESVWPKLYERAPAETATFVRQMEDQHAEIERLSAKVNTSFGVWGNTRSVTSREKLADDLDKLLVPLKEHMASEEQHVVPLMERYITADEWSRTVRDQAGDSDPAALTLVFGMLMYEADPGIIDMIVSNMPAEAQPVIRGMAAQAFAAHSELVHGTATPPRSTDL